MSAQAFSVGSMVDDKYLILDLLGRGGMSNVWLARDERIEKLWAIKEIKPNVDGIRGAAMRQALIDEANFMKLLDHAAIPRVVDIVDTGETTFVVMDYVEGRSTGRMLREQGHPFAQEDVVDWGIQLCDVLSYLHSRKPAIVYRDLKPDNVIVTADGRVKLIDFGIAIRLSNDGLQDVLRMGTPGYAPPEQLCAGGECEDEAWQGANVDGRADVYALGVTLYALVTGHVPDWRQPSGADDLAPFSLRPIREWNPQLSEGLERIILQATKKDPNDRYQTIAQMRLDLERYPELTDAWRVAQTHILTRFRLLCLSTALLCALGAGCLVGRMVVIRTSYEGLLHEASMATSVSADDKPSEAERLCVLAIRTSPGDIEAYQRLLQVYETDYRLTEGEERRLRDAYRLATTLERHPQYARLCFDIGTCYLSYYGVDYEGGSVGNAAIYSIAAASPWFKRVVEACAENGEAHPQEMSAQDVRSASAYLVVSQFTESVTRASQEGRAAVEDYLAFWQALKEVLEDEAGLTGTPTLPEGVRARLCQVGTEAIASPLYLGGFARAGVTREDAREMLRLLQSCLEGCVSASGTDEYAKVFGPMTTEMRENLTVADRNIDNTFLNPVERQQAEEGAR